jgi:hypothetical protein
MNASFMTFGIADAFSLASRGLPGFGKSQAEAGRHLTKWYDLISNTFATGVFGWT